MTFLELYNLRIEQLNIQEQIDEKIKKLDCKDVVNNFLFNERNLNRIYTRKLSNSSIFQYISTLKSQMEEIDKHQNEILKKIKDNEFCNLK